MKSTGLNTAHIKTSVRPQDDLYRHMNGAWIDSAEIPADRSSDGAFYRLYENAEKQVREIIEELAGQSHEVGTISQKIGDLYKSFMDQDRANQLGISPIKADLDLALSVSDLDSFHDVLGDLERRGLGGLFYESVTGDKMDSQTNITYIGHYNKHEDPPEYPKCG